MKQSWLSLIILILLLLFGRASPSTAQDQKQQEENENKSGGDPEPPTLSCEDKDSLAFYNNLLHIPIVFVDRFKDEGILIGQFSSPLNVSFQKFEFKLTPEKKNEKGLFFAAASEWEEEISRKTFLKKFKNYFWLISYLTINQENIICEAHQFLGWDALRISFAQGQHNYSVDTLKFWENVSSKAVYFYKIETNYKVGNTLIGDAAYWLFVDPTNGIKLPGDETIEQLEDGNLVRRIQKFDDGSEYRIVDHGVFFINDDTIFHTVEVKISKFPRVRLAYMDFGMLKIRPKSIAKKYFVENLGKTPWLCFYDRSQKLLRTIEGVYVEDMENNDNGNSSKKDKNGNKKNGQK